MADHTPGPWKAIRPAKKSRHWQVGANGALGGMSAMAGANVLWSLATIDNGAPGDTLETEEANARLIAAAPDLLGALKAMMAIQDSTNDCWCAESKPATCEACACRAAIAKAEGK